MSKVLMITGASSGIGAATAREAVAAGYRVALLARSQDKLTALTNELGDQSRAYRCDVTSYAQQLGVVQRVAGDFGGIDAVFANAGRGIGGGGYTKGDPSDWEDLVSVNVLGLMYTVRATAEELIKSKGRLLITSSIAGRRTMKASVYSATKWAATAVGYNAGEELAEHGVQVTVIEPGMVDTPFFDSEKPGALRAEDVASAVLFVLSRPPHVRINELLVTPQR